MVLAFRSGDAYVLTDASNGAALGEAPKRELIKVSVNNAMRTQLRAAIAGLTLNDPDPGVRLSAVQEILSSLDAETAEVLRERQPKEDDPQVREAIGAALALAALNARSRRPAWRPSPTSPVAWSHRYATAW